MHLIDAGGSCVLFHATPSFALWAWPLNVLRHAQIMHLKRRDLI
jgi:hypothetical protein